MSKRPPILAVVDIGSNSVRLKVARVRGARAVETIEESRERTRLGVNLGVSKRLDRDSMRTSADAARMFVKEAKKHGANSIAVIATAAAREASNQDEFIAMLRRRGMKPLVIDAVQEARLGFLSAATCFPLSRGVSAVFDIGGGSAQITLACQGVICKTVSLPLGAVRLTRQFGGPAAIAKARFQSCITYVDRLLAQALSGWNHAPGLVLGTGGTISSLAHVAALRRLEAHLPSARSRPLSRDADLAPILADMRRLNVEDRGLYLGAVADRADIIVAGLLVADRILAVLAATHVTPHEGGIRDGALLQMSLPGGLETPMSHAPQVINDLRRRCHDDTRHTSHVAILAGRLLDQIRPDDPARPLLHTAALLHDVGQLVEYESHHRRSADIIRAAAIPGLSAREVEIVACIARYHRKSLPEKTHHHFNLLPARDQRLVKRLAAVLRIADAMDRSHAQHVRTFRLTGSKHAWQLDLTHTGSIPRELKAAREKADLWRQVFGPVQFSG